MVLEQSCSANLSETNSWDILPRWLLVLKYTSLFWAFHPRLYPGLFSWYLFATRKIVQKLRCGRENRLCLIQGTVGFPRSQTSIGGSFLFYFARLHSWSGNMSTDIYIIAVDCQFIPIPLTKRGSLLLNAPHPGKLTCFDKSGANNAEFANFETLN